MRETRRVVNYAVNGVGAGHVSRLIAISRWLRRLTAQFDLQLEIYFLTSSEANRLLFVESFPSFKLPSKTVIEEAGADAVQFEALAEGWVTNTLALLRPDLLVVDTFPQGYFDELTRSFEYSRRRAFVYRPLKESHATRTEFRRALSHYDAILIPEYEGRAAVHLPAEARAKTRYTGPVMLREREEVPGRAEARALLGASEEETVVYITAGGGGDAGAETQIRTAYEALKDEGRLHFVIGAGALYRGRPIYAERVTWLAGDNALELMSAFDVAVSAAGYNSFNELMYMGVPTVFLPQQKWADEQAARAERAARAGAAVVLPCDSERTAIRRAVEVWRDPLRRAAARDAARTLVPHNHARDAARALLELLTAGVGAGVSGQENGHGSNDDTR